MDLERAKVYNSQMNTINSLMVDIEKEVEGFFKKVEDPVVNDMCRIYFQNMRTLKMEGTPG